MLRSLWAAKSPLASIMGRRATAQAPDAIVQHVRIKNRRRMRNVAIGAGVMYVCWSAYLTRVVVPPLAKHLEEDGEPIFFPFPFTFQVVESKPYKGTDPEWQEYIRIARDRELLLKIRNDMLETVRAAAETNPVLIHRCGRKFQVRKHWLDLEFPYRPPPKITRDGLLLSPDGLELVTMEIEPMTMLRISRALWPMPVAQSATAFVGTLVRQNLQNVARYFGFEPAEPAKPQNSLAAALQKRLDQAGAEGRTAKDGSSSSSSAGSGAEEPPTGRSIVPTTALPTDPIGSTTSSSSPSSPRENDGDGRDLDRILNAKDLIPFESLRSSIDDAWLEFKKKLSQTWQPLRPQPPGGCVGVSGLVELQSVNSRIMIEVSAFWNPKTRKYDPQTMHMKLQSIRPRNQVPL